MEFRYMHSHAVHRNKKMYKLETIGLNNCTEYGILIHNIGSLPFIRRASGTSLAALFEAGVGQ